MLLSAIQIKVEIQKSSKKFNKPMTSFSIRTRGKPMIDMVWTDSRVAVAVEEVVWMISSVKCSEAVEAEDNNKNKE